MVNIKYTDEQRLHMFMDTAHRIIEKDYWEKKIRPLGEIEKYNEYEIEIVFETGMAHGRRSQMEESDIDLVLPLMRRFLTEVEPLHTGRMLKSIDALGITSPSDWLNEVKFSWRQMNDKKFPFYTHNGVSIGMRPAPGERLIRWARNGPPESEMGSQSISLIDACDVYLNNDHLHDKEIGARPKKEYIRNIAGSIPPVLSRNLRAVITSAAVLNFIMLHRIVRSDPRFKCQDTCREATMLRKITKSHLDSLSRQSMAEMLSARNDG